VVTEPPRCHRTCMAIMGRWQAGPVIFSKFFKIFKHPHFDIGISDLLDVQTSSNFGGRQIGTQVATSLFISSSKS
jgi:hypothetical protein